jgi:hypothetical protein
MYQVIIITAVSNTDKKNKTKVVKGPGIEIGNMAMSNKHLCVIKNHVCHIDGT